MLDYIKDKFDSFMNSKYFHELESHLADFIKENYKNGFSNPAYVEVELQKQDHADRKYSLYLKVYYKSNIPEKAILREHSEDFYDILEMPEAYNKVIKNQGSVKFRVDDIIAVLSYKPDFVKPIQFRELGDFVNTLSYRSKITGKTVTIFDKVFRKQVKFQFKTIEGIKTIIRNYSDILSIPVDISQTLDKDGIVTYQENTT